jgi:DnaJ-class molecular chaperone
MKYPFGLTVEAMQDRVPAPKPTKAVLCPVCVGRGRIPRPFSLETHRCHGCDGKGWVAI